MNGYSSTDPPTAGRQRRGALALVVLLAFAALGYWAGRGWQSQQSDYPVLATVAGCDLRAGPCSAQIGAGSVRLAVDPPGIPLMQTLRLTVDARGLGVDGVVVDIRGTNMDMGLNRIRLEPASGDVWRGETILPLCSQRRMTWEATVLLDGDTHGSVAFPFHTERP